MKELIVPVVMSMCSSALASITAIFVTLSVIETRVDYIERDLTMIHSLSSEVALMQREMSRNSERLKYMQKEIDLK